MTDLPTFFKAISCPGPKQPWQTITVPLREPTPTEVLVRVHASGICHGDHFVHEGTFPGLAYPRTPGHEVVGRVAAVGAVLSALGPSARFRIGSLVGVGWNGGYCAACDACRRGDFGGCASQAITGATFDGGHAEYLYASETAIVSIPEECLEQASYAELAPLLCAGATVYEALRKTPFSPGDLCLVQGIGGLGHLAIQYAVRLGLKVYAVSSGPTKAALATSLGAHGYIDTSAHGLSVVERVQAMGGAKVILCTAPSAEQTSALIPAVARDGVVTLVGVAVDGDVRANTGLMIMRRATLRGWGCGSARETESCVQFSMLTDVKAMVQEFGFEDFVRAYDDTMHGKPQFRNVIVFP